MGKRITEKRITVLIVDDSALMRRKLTGIINSDPELRVIGAARDGGEGLEMARTLEPDVVTLDVNLPDMDGITCLQHIMIETPRPCVMISAYTGRDSMETFEALELGAVDFLEKPSGEISRDIGKQAGDIVRKVKGAAYANLSAITRQKAVPPVHRRQGGPRSDAGAPDRVVVIGVSTGGPRTLMRIIPALPADLDAPVLVVQHMPRRFTESFANRLNDSSLLAVREAKHGEAIVDNAVYVAPGDTHLLLNRSLNRVSAALVRPARGDMNIPSVEKAMASAIDVFGDRTVGVILTGMGDDGAGAMERLHGLGGETLAESEETAILHGMPREVIARGAAKTVAPAGEIAERIVEAVRR